MLQDFHFRSRKIELLNFGNIWKAAILLAERMSSEFLVIWSTS